MAVRRLLILTGIVKIFAWILDAFRRAFQWFVYDATPRQRIAVFVGLTVLIVIAVFTWQCNSIRSKKQEIERLQNEKARANIEGRMKDARIIEGQLEVLRKEDAEQDKAVEESDSIFEATVGKDSSEYNPDDATRLFCERFPADSTCEEYNAWKANQ